MPLARVVPRWIAQGFYETTQTDTGISQLNVSFDPYSRIIIVISNKHEGYGSQEATEIIHRHCYQLPDV